jgi:hypothetical protein
MFGLFLLELLHAAFRMVHFLSTPILRSNFGTTELVYFGQWKAPLHWVIRKSQSEENT